MCVYTSGEDKKTSTVTVSGMLVAVQQYIHPQQYIYIQRYINVQRYIYRQPIHTAVHIRMYPYTVVHTHSIHTTHTHHTHTTHTTPQVYVTLHTPAQI